MISDSEIKKLAGLARIALSDKELADYAAKLDSILEYVKELQGIDTSEVEPLSHVHGVTNILREDRVISACDRVDEFDPEASLKNAPQTSGKFIKVPLIIDSEAES
jgi:aspartyl-tRNA(Asn)/glutamyl-tRNA(Gln) amidotransferase subunit C